MKDIWSEMIKLEGIRERFLKTAMQSFDIEHNKKVKALQEECALQGHEPVYQDSVLCLERTACNKCGLTLEDQ